MVNRRLIRPTLAEVRNQGKPGEKGGARRKPVPPENTAAEAFYYVKQMQAKTPMVIVFQDGERLRGWIEWYDRTCIKVHRNDGPNLLVYKRAIKYMHKDEEAAVGDAEAEYALAETPGDD